MKLDSGQHVPRFSGLRAASLARFQTWVFFPLPPMEGLGFMTFRSSPMTVIGRF
jgi:hypothetical protein